MGVDTVLRVTVLDRRVGPGPAWVGDPVGSWLDDAASWVCPLAAAGVPLRLLADPAGDDGEGLLVVPDPGAWPEPVDRASGTGRPLLTGRAPDDAGSVLQAATRALGALVRPDLRGVLVLRLDDPGSSQRRHLRSWAHEPVPPAIWDALWRELEGFGRVSVFCCPGWVDEDGTVRRSRDASPEEWRSLDQGVAAGLADLECHGFTHLHPDRSRWAAAPDRRDNPDWYRELGAPGASVEAEASVLAAWQAECGPGTTVVAPGEAWGLATVAAARERGFRLFNSWSVCRLDLAALPVWAPAIGSPYLDQADPRWLAGGLPVVGYWHDRDMAVHGPGWVTEQLGAWRDAGARRAMAFADLARAWEPIDAVLAGGGGGGGAGEVTIRSAPPVPMLIDRP